MGRRQIQKQAKKEQVFVINSYHDYIYIISKTLYYFPCTINKTINDLRTSRSTFLYTYTVKPELFPL